MSIALQTTVLALCGCGRLDFDAVDDAGRGKLAQTGDGPLVDSQLGSGSYVNLDTTAPYVPLDGTAVPVDGFFLDADDENFTVPLPFPFTFYQVTYNTMTVNVNGYVTFTTPPQGSVTGDNQCPLTTGLPDGMIAVFWDDLWVATADPASAILKQTAGVAPNRTFTIEWRDLDAFYMKGNNWWSQGIFATQQLVLHEDGAIEIHYGPRGHLSAFYNGDCGVQRELGCSATVGIKSGGGGPMQLVQCGTSTGPGPGYAPLAEGRVLQFMPQ